MVSNYSMKIHDRGFYGSGKSGIAKHVEPPVNLVTRPLEDPVITETTSNKNIYDLFMKYSNKDYYSVSKEWELNTLVEIIKAFGTDDLQVWHAQQYQSPYFGDNHVDFLEDSFKYIITGKRDIDLYTWGNILDKADVRANINAELKPYTSLFFSKTTVYPFSTTDTVSFEYSVVNYVTKSYEKSKGLDDILHTAFILFCIKK